MPIYEYRCTSCAKTFEVFAKFSDPPPLACEHCGATTIEKVLHPVGIHYKGSGFYATDYAGKGSSGKGSSSGASGSGGGESKGSEGGSSGDGGSTKGSDSGASGGTSSSGSGSSAD